MKKLIIFILFFIVVFGIYLYFYFIPKDYEIKYDVDGFEVTETYNKKEKIYYYLIDNKYDFIVEKKYSNKRRLLQKIESSDNCITSSFKDDILNEICYIEEENYQVISNLTQPKKIAEQKNVTIYNYDNSIYTLWNYKGVYLIEEGRFEDIDLIKKSIYNNRLSVLIDYLFVLPDYDNTEYNSFILVDVENGKKTVWDIDYEISSDSYVLGTYEDDIYLVDRKNKIEYKINPFRKKIEIVGTNEKKGTIYNNGFEGISLVKLTSKDYEFTYNSFYNYFVENDNLFLSYLDKKNKTKISSFDGGEIIKIDNETIYYLTDFTLYKFSPNEGNIKLLENFEWNFNKSNQIFIYNK